MRVEKRSDGDLNCEAWFSEELPTPLYRYRLSRHWADPPHLVAWMLNPSTADHEVLDNTIKGIETRAQAWGYGGLTVINLFAFRTKDPSLMKAAADPIGPGNDDVILDVLHAAAANGSIVAGSPAYHPPAPCSHTADGPVAPAIPMAASAAKPRYMLAPPGLRHSGRGGVPPERRRAVAGAG